MLKSTLTKEIQCSNNPDISIIFSALKLFKFILFIFSHPENIKDISSTDSVLKLKMSISSIFLHPLKIFDIFFTFFVSKFFKFILVKDKHPSNNPDISSTFSVEILLIFISFKYWQFLNICDISIILFVLKSSKSINSKCVLKNKLLIDITFDVLNPLFLKFVKFIQSSKELIIDIIVIFFSENNSTETNEVIFLNI